jgi:RHS repeat-associated protein
MGGNTLAEGDGSGNLTAEYIYFGSKRIARIDLPANTVHYYLSDHLGSTSVVVGAAGMIEEESDYYPFGTEVVVTGPGTNELKFTGKRRDTESQLDYFGARYYGNAVGRWTSPDPINFSKKHLIKPQRWNKYSYVQNDPLGSIDPDGLDDFKIFLVYTHEVHQNAPHTDWARVKATLEKEGHTVSIDHENTTGKELKGALNSSSHVIFVGHTVFADAKAAAVKTGDATVGDGKTDSQNSIVNPNAPPGLQLQTQWLPAMPVGDVTAPTVGIFGCDSNQLSGQYSSTTFTGVDSGPDNLTSMNGLDLAAGQYALDLGAGKDPAQAATDATNALGQTKDPMDKGDTVQTVKPEKKE